MVTPVTSSRDKLLRAVLSFLSRPTEGGMPVDGISFQEKTGYSVRSMRFLKRVPKEKVCQRLHLDTMSVSKKLERSTVRTLLSTSESVHMRPPRHHEVPRVTRLQESFSLLQDSNLTSAHFDPGLFPLAKKKRDEFTSQATGQSVLHLLQASPEWWHSGTHQW